MNQSIEHLEIIDFLKTCAPLDTISDKDIDSLVTTASTGYFRTQEVILQAGMHNKEVFLIRKGAVSITGLDGEIIHQLDVSGWFGHGAWFQKGIMPATAKTTEDTLLYVFPIEKIVFLMQTYDTVKTYFSNHSRNRLRQAIIDYRGDSQTQLISSSIEEIKLRTSLTVNSSTSIRETAQIMSKEKRTAALIIDQGKLRGIATESDFCRKVVAEGLDVDTPIEKVMTLDPMIVNGSVSASEALLIMAKMRIHHLPFHRNDGEFSTITAADLIQFQSHNPLFLITDIYGSLTVEEIKQHSKKIPEMLVDLVNSSLAAYDIGNLISSVGESINQRLIQLAEQEFGEPPIAYGWLIAGSQARREQTVHTDQDSALILSDDYNVEEHYKYFAQFTKFVCDGLNECGFVYCPGDIMASNPKWQMTVSQWRDKFKNWIYQPEPEALLYSTIFFDMRTIYGDAQLLESVSDEMLSVIPQQAPFMANIARNALQFSPPLGLFRSFVLEKSGAEEKALNLKKRGVAPVTDLARAYALAGGIDALNTQDRLKAAASHNLMSAQASEDLIEAFAFINEVRLSHQAKQIELNKTPDNYVPPEQLSSLEREHLKDAFDIVSSMQKYLRQRY